MLKDVLQSILPTNFKYAISTKSVWDGSGVKQKPWNLWAEILQALYGLIRRIYLLSASLNIGAGIYLLLQICL